MTVDRHSWPDITRSNVDSVLVSQWTVDTPERQQAVAEATITEWERTPWPQGCLSFDCFVNTDGDTVLNYSQWASDEAFREFVQTDRSTLISGIEDTAQNIELADPIEYRLYRSRISDGEPQNPGCLVVVSFESDGPEQQRQFVDSLFAVSPDLPSGCISANFHLSTDGTRILNCVEWTDEEAHREMIDTIPADDEMRRLIDSEMRPMEFERYHLYCRSL